jgi:hypothetical protein
VKLDRYVYQPKPEQSGWLMNYRHPEGYVLGTLPVLRFEKNTPQLTLGLPPSLWTRALGVKAELDDGSSCWFMFEAVEQPGDRSCAGCCEIIESEPDHELCETPVELYPHVAFSLLPRSWLRVCRSNAGP